MIRKPNPGICSCSEVRQRARHQERNTQSNLFCDIIIIASANTLNQLERFFSYSFRLDTHLKVNKCKLSYYFQLNWKAEQIELSMCLNIILLQMRFIYYEVINIISDPFKVYSISKQENLLNLVNPQTALNNCILFSSYDDCIDSITTVQ